MVVGLIQLAHKMSRTPSQPPSVPCFSCCSFSFSRLLCPVSCRFLCHSTPAPVSLILSVCIFLVTNVARPKSRFYERILLFVASCPSPLFCLLCICFIFTYLHFLFALRQSLVGPLRALYGSGWAKVGQGQGHDVCASIKIVSYALACIFSCYSMYNSFLQYNSLSRMTV